MAKLRRQSGIVLSIPLFGDFTLSQIPAQFEPAKYERMVFGLILILMMMFRPQGHLAASAEAGTLRWLCWNYAASARDSADCRR